MAYQTDGVVAKLLKEVAQANRLWLREVQHLPACRSLLRQPGPAVLVLMLGRDVVHELALLQEVSVAAPDTAVVVVGDTNNPALAALAWDLGARCVLQPPQPVELLPDVVLRLLSSEKA